MDIVFKSCVALTLAFMLIAPLFGEWFRENTRLYSDISTVLILGTVAVTFFFSRYKKSSVFVERIWAEIHDCGSYINNVKADNLKAYETVVYNHLNADFFAVNSDVCLSEREFSFQAVKKKNILYFAKCKKLTAADFFACSDAVTSAMAAANVRQKQTAVLLIAADSIDTDVLSYSKMTTVLGKIMVYPMLVDVPAGLAYFFNDNSGKTAFALKNALGYPDGQIPEECKQKAQLPFQKELEKKMQYFTIKDYKDGRFNPRVK